MLNTGSSLSKRMATCSLKLSSQAYVLISRMAARSSDINVTLLSVILTTFMRKALLAPPKLPCEQFERRPSSHVAGRVKEWQVSWFVLGTITFNGTDTVVCRYCQTACTKRLHISIKPFFCSVPLKIIVPKTDQLTCHPFTGYLYKVNKLAKRYKLCCVW